MCGVTAAGAAYCWGDGGQGQLGDGSLTARTLTAVQVSGSGTGDLVFTDISAALLHSCGITSAGRAYCWGYNGEGQVGDSTITRRVLPTRVAGSGTGARIFTAVRTTEASSCARNTSSQVLCWGFNLRSGSGPNDLVPAMTFSGTTTDFSMGLEHTCAIVNSALYCLGRNEFGQVGPSANPIQTIPLLVPLNERAALRVWAGGRSTCASTADGIFCFGRNLSGLLGIGTSAVEGVRDPTRMITEASIASFHSPSACRRSQ
jgi:alpha-tubulin suppressor-like RCC1 family protein